jgi:ankyrin repeat protein
LGKVDGGEIFKLTVGSPESSVGVMPFPFLEQIKLRVTRWLAQTQRLLVQFAVPILLGMLLGAIAGIPGGPIGKLSGGVIGGSLNGYLAWRKLSQANIASLGLAALWGILNGFLLFALYWASVCRYFPTWPPIASFPYGWGLGAIVLAVMLTVIYHWSKPGKPWSWFIRLGWGFLFGCVCFFLPIPSSLGLILLALLPNLLLHDWLPTQTSARSKQWLAKRGVIVSRRLALGFLVLQLGISFGVMYVPFLHPLVKAAEAGDLAQVKELWRGQSDRQVNGLALLQAIERQKLPVAKFLLQPGTEVNTRNFYGDTPLSLAIFAAGLSKKDACQADWETLATDLVKAGADVNGRGGFLGNPPLLQAAQNDCIKLVKALLQARAHPNARNDMGETALWRTNNEIRKLLIAAGTDLNVMSYSLPLHGKHGRTVLMQAIAIYTDNPNNALSTAKLLVQAAADVTAKNAEGETALSLAKPTDNAELIQILKRAGARD